MNDPATGTGNLLDTTDCLEAIDVFKGWKNFLFFVVILSMLILQASFWLLNNGFVITSRDDKVLPPVVTKVAQEVQVAAPAAAAAEQVTPPAATIPPDEIAEAAKQVVADTNTAQLPAVPAEPAENAAPAAPPAAPSAATQFKVNMVYLGWLIRLCNFALIVAGTMYCLTILFCLKISLLGRLGGIKHISKAFFLSLTALVLLLPWQLAFGGVLAGVIYTPQQLLDANAAAAGGSTFAKVLLFIRFTGLWLVVILILFSAQLRSRRWTKGILRRLEVMQ